MAPGGHVGAWMEVSDGQGSDMQDGGSSPEVKAAQAQRWKLPPNNSVQRLRRPRASDRTQLGEDKCAHICLVCKESRARHVWCGVVWS